MTSRDISELGPLERENHVALLIDRAMKAEGEGQIDLAADLFGQAAAIGCNPDLDLWYGVRLLLLGRLDEAVAALERAWTAAPGRADIGLYLAQALRDQPGREQALLSDLIAAGSIDFDIHVALIHSLERTKQASSLSLSLARSEHMLVANNDFAIFAGSRWSLLGMFDRAMDSFARAFHLSVYQPALVYEAAAEAILACDSEPPLTLLQNLHSALGRVDLSEATFLSIRAAVVRCSALKAWSHFVGPQAHALPSPELIDLLADTSAESLRQTFTALSHEIRESRTDERERIVEQIGKELVDPFALKKSGFDFDVWFEKHDDLQKHFRADSVLFQRTALSDAAFQLHRNMLESGYLCLVSPLDGLAHRSNCGFVLEYLRDRGIPHAGSGAAYFMSSGEPAFVMFSGEENWPMAWFYPRLNLIIRERGFIEVDRYLISNIVDLQTIIVKRLTSSLAYCYGSDAKRRQLAIFGSNDFVSTHLFEDISGFCKLVEAGVAPLVEQVLVSSNEPYGSFEELFPEFASHCAIHRSRFQDCVAYNELVQGLDAFPVRVAGGFATQQSADRVLSLARKKCLSRWNDRFQQLRSNHFPIVAVNLRVKRRGWAVTPARIAAMLDRFVEHYPSAAFIFDGSVLLSENEVPDETMFAEQSLIENIMSLMDTGAPHVVVVGERLSDAIIATQIADMHLSIQGTSTTRAVLISNKPGVIIGPAQFWWDVRNYRKECILQLDLRKFSIDGTVGNMSEVDFDCDPAVVLSALLSTANRAVQRSILVPSSM